MRSKELVIFEGSVIVCLVSESIVVKSGTSEGIFKLQWFFVRFSLWLGLGFV